MKKRFVTFISLVASAVFSFSAASQDYLPKWEEGFLDIHTIATGRGDAALIVMPDGTTMMIDAGDNAKAKDTQHPDASKSPAEWQALYISNVLKSLPYKDDVLDYAMVTHLHNDHIGTAKNASYGEHGFLLSGMTHVGELLHFNKFVDRGYPKYDFPSKKKVLDADKGFMEDYIKFVNYTVSQGTVAEQFAVGSNKQFVLVHNPEKYKKNFEIRNLCGNGRVWKGRGNGSTKMYKGDPKLFDENMNSCGIRLTYGKFVYYNGGDLSGGNWPIYKSKERDFESYVADVCGKVTVLKANHHGYYETANAHFLQTLSPQVILIDARSENHPVASTFTRMTDHLVWKGAEDCQFYITVDQAKEKLGKELWSRFNPWGHIVIRVYPGGTKYQVFVLDADSTDYHIKYKSEIVKL